jgi:transposase
MEKLQILRDSPSYGELIELYRSERHPKLKERFHALFLMHELKNCTEVAKILKRSRRSIQLWVNAFNEGGLEEIIPNAPPGRPPRLSESQMEELKTDVLTHPRELGYDFSNWEGKNLSHHIEKKFSVVLKVRQCQKLLHKMGFSLQRPRYKFPKADPEKQKEFVEKFKKRWILLEKTT